MGKFWGKSSESQENIRKFKFAMILYYAVIIIGITVFISTSTIFKTDDVLKSKVSELTSALNVQMQMNINSYLSKVETTAALLFAEKEVYLYDATNESNDEYESLNTENFISDKLYSLCIMENFVDFGIVYRNNHTVGKLSNNTKELLGDRLYEDLAASINRERTHDGWFAGYNGNYNRIYYVKRVNDNAVLVTSFYTTELESVFEHPGGIADMEIRLMEASNVIIYSSVENETGTQLGSEISTRIGDHSSATLMDDQYLITVNQCGDNWKVICSVPTQIILKEKNYVEYYILTIGAIAAIIAIGLSIILSFGISGSVDKTFTSLNRKAHIDLLTGVLNKRSFEERVEAILKKASDAEYYALILIDVDNFKGVNDTLGHAYGDKVLAGVGEILRNTFQPEDTPGRLGGDEFCVLMKMKDADSDAERLAAIDEKCAELGAVFRNTYTGDDKNYKVSASIGVSVYPTKGTSFLELYKKADSALYLSKKKGKDTFTIYSEEQE